jgi:Cu+-exporting ATPase
MLQNLYDGWAVTITNVLMIVLYVVSMVAFVLLVKKSAEANLEIDLVCHMKVDPKTSLQTSYQGKTYYFCAPTCKRAFEKNPEAYIQ